MFWLLAAVIVAVVLALVIVPVLRPVATESDSSRADQLRRLSELEDDAASGDIAPDNTAQARAEIERAVITTIESQSFTTGSASTAMPVVIVCLGLIAGAFSLYLHLGQPDIATYLASHPRAELNQPATSLDILLERVRERVRQYPDDVDAWRVLARSMLEMNQADEAVHATEQLVRLAPADTQHQLMLADALTLQADGRMPPRAIELVNDAIRKNPNNGNAYVMRGIALQQQGKTAEAVAAWRQALVLLPADSPVKRDLQSVLGIDDSEQQSAASGLAVEMAVSLGAELADKFPPETPVFIFVRAVGGPPAPLVASRHSVSDLPFEVRLDDSRTMLPGVSFDQFSQFSAVARVSLSGQAIASPGDYEVRSAPFELPLEAPLALVITDQVSN